MCAHASMRATLIRLSRKTLEGYAMFPLQCVGVGAQKVSGRLRQQSDGIGEWSFGMQVSNDIHRTYLLTKKNN